MFSNNGNVNTIKAVNKIASRLMYKGKALGKTLDLKQRAHYTVVLREIAFCLIACSSSPCFHDGTCLLDQTGSYKCACLAGYTGQRCENREYTSEGGVKVSPGAGVERALRAYWGCHFLVSGMVCPRWDTSGHSHWVDLRKAGPPLSQEVWYYPGLPIAFPAFTCCRHH